MDKVVPILSVAVLPIAAHRVALENWEHGAPDAVRIGQPKLLGLAAIRQ